jgi:hypothetical protein
MGPLLFRLGASLLIFSVTPGSSADQRTRYEGWIPMSSEQIALNSICIGFAASMRAPEFKGLERVATSSGIEFRRSNKVVTKYPDVIGVDVWARPSQCGSLERAKQPRDLGADTLGGLELHLSWKHDFELRPAEVLDYGKKHLSRSNIRLFLFHVKGTNIPLEDHLILHVLTQDGIERAKLSGRP